MKLKSLLKKTFLWDTPAEEAFFALTLWGIGLYLTFSAVLWLWVEGIIPTPFLPNGNDEISVTVPIVWGWAALLSMYAVWRFACFYFDFCRSRRWLIINFCSLIILYVSGLCAIGHDSQTHDIPIMGWVILTSAITFWIFPALLLTRVRCRSYIANALTWSAGSLIIAIVVTHAHFYFKEVKFGGSPQYTPWENFCINLAQWYPLAGVGWLWLTLLGLGLLLAGYILTAKLFAEAAQIPLRRMFGRAVLTLWGLAAATYLFFLLMALLASNQAAQNVKDLERRFGRPVNGETLAKYYFANEQTDAEFWQTIKVLNQNYEKNDNIGIPDIIPPELAQEWRQAFETTRDALEQWEKMFAGVIPPNEYLLTQGQICWYWTPEHHYIRQFCDIELKKLYIALLDGDICTALSRYDRIKHAEDSLLRVIDFAGIFDWYFCVRVRLTALQWLLESGRLSGDQLQTLADGLITTEQTIPSLAERSLYGEAVQGLDFFDMYGQGTPYYDIMGFPLETLRYTMPQLWWYAAKDKAYLAGYFNTPDLDGMAIESWQQQVFVVSDELLPQTSIKLSVHKLTARLHAAQIMIAAAKYKLLHGSYPEHWDDPASANPIQYSKGDFEIKLYTGEKINNNWYYKDVVQTFPAIICLDPQTKPDKYGVIRCRDILFWLRLKP